MLFPQQLTHNGGSTRPQHEARCPKNTQEWKDERNGGKCGFAHVIGNKEAIHNTVD